ncbi:ABC transporter permease, partial [Streptomyces lonarensis]
ATPPPGPVPQQQPHPQQGGQAPQYPAGPYPQQGQPQAPAAPPQGPPSGGFPQYQGAPQHASAPPQQGVQQPGTPPYQGAPQHTAAPLHQGEAQRPDGPSTDRPVQNGGSGGPDAAPGSEVPPAHLGNALLAEWTKIRSVRSTIWTLLVMMVVTVGIGTGVAAIISATSEQGFDPPIAGFIGILLGHIAIVTFGVLVTSTEYTTGMIRTSLVASPRRGRLLAAKCVIFSVISFAAVAVALGLTLVLSSALLSDTEAAREMPGDAWLTSVLGVALYVTLLGLLGLAMGSLLRSSAGAITVMLGIVLLPTIAAPFLYISESMRDVAEQIDAFSAIGGMSALSVSYTGDFDHSGWPQTAVLAAVVAAALLGAWARLRSADA